MATLTELIRQEDPKRPYTDEQLAQMLQLRREQVVELRRINGIPNSWMRLRPALVVEMQKLLEQEPGLSDRSLTLRLNAMGYNVSRYLVKELHSNLPEKEAEPQPEPAVEITTQEETEGTNVFAGMIGYDGGLKAQIHQAKAAVSYPPNGLHTLIIGPSGSGREYVPLCGAAGPAGAGCPLCLLQLRRLRRQPAAAEQPVVWLCARRVQRCQRHQGRPGAEGRRRHPVFG